MHATTVSNVHRIMAVVPICIALVMLAVPNRVSPMEVPAEARAAAQGFLDVTIANAKKDPSWFQEKWKVNVEGDFSLVVLGEPYRTYFLGRPEVSSFVDHQNLVHESHFTGFTFPVFHDSRFIGSVRTEVTDEQWRFAGRFFANDPKDIRIVEMQQQLSGNDTYSIGAIRSKSLGVYIVVLENGSLSQLAPMAPWTAKIIFVEANSEMGYPLVDYDTVKHYLVKKARDVTEDIQTEKPKSDD